MIIIDVIIYIIIEFLLKQGNPTLSIIIFITIDLSLEYVF